jgi:hypothetical protein
MNFSNSSPVGTGSGSIPTTDLATAPAAGTVSDAYISPALNDVGALVRVTRAQDLAWIQGHYPDLGAAIAPVLLSSTTVLDASVHQRRMLIATAPITINAPGVFGNLGPNFDCMVVAEATVTLGSGITSSVATLAAGSWARLVGYSNGGGNVCRALTAAVSTAPAISVSASGAPFVAAGSSTVSVSLVVSLANYSAAPTLQISIDGGAYAALPGSPTVTSSGVTGLAVALGGGTHTIAIKDTGTSLVSNTANVTVAAVTIASVPTTGWVNGTAKALTGATATLAGITTAYVVLYDGTAEVGSRQAFTSSATLAALSMTPGSTNSTTKVRVYSAASGGNLLAETAAFTVTAAAGAMPVLGLTAGASVISANGLYKFVNYGGVAPNPIAGNHNIQLVIVRVNPTGVNAGNDGGTSYSGNTFPTGSNASDGTVDGTHGGFATLAWGYNATATGTASSATMAANPPAKNSSGSLVGLLPGAFYWDAYTSPPSIAAGSTLYLIATTSDGQTVAVGPFTRG